MWDDLKKTVKDGFSVAAAKTEEFTKIGRAKLDLMNLNKSLNRTFQDLGVEVHAQITEGAKGPIPQNMKVKGLVEKIDKFRQSIREKELEMEAIRKSGAQGAEGEPDEDVPVSPEKPGTQTGNRKKGPRGGK
jgi:hypothetical protein